MTTDKWERLLEASVAKHGETYLHLHHLGVIAAERLNIPLAIARLRRSISLRPTAVAHRNLGALLSDPAEMLPHFLKAWALVSAPVGAARGPSASLRKRLQYDLAGDIAIFLTTVGVLVDAGHLPNVTSTWPHLKAFLSELPSAPACVDRGPHCDHDGVAFAARD